MQRIRGKLVFRAELKHSTQTEDELHVGIKTKMDSDIDTHTKKNEIKMTLGQKGAQCGIAQT